MLKSLKRFGRSLLGIRNDTDFYSQGGEDAIVSNTFSYVIPVSNGFYVDIGAYHPYKHSNTQILYKAGWSGVNIDPRPGTKALFDKYRRRDINIEAGIARHDGEMTYFILEEGSTMNSFSRENLEKLGVFSQVKKTLTIPVFSLMSLLRRFPQIRDVDYLNIDAEGFELEILEGMDFSDCCPKVISIEQNGVFYLSELMSSDVAGFLSKKGYLPYAKNVLLPNVSTAFYIRSEFIGRQ
jgi:FkbM family methyltransferase